MSEITQGRLEIALGLLREVDSGVDYFMPPCECERCATMRRLLHDIHSFVVYFDGEPDED